MQARFLVTFGALILSAWAATATATAAESDQFSRRLEPLADSTVTLNLYVNAALDEIVDHWRGPRDDSEFAKKFKTKVALGLIIHNGEIWVELNDGIEKLNRPMGDNVLSIIPKGRKFGTKIMGTASTIQLAGSRVGVDKLGHFLSYGYHLYTEADREGLTEAEQLQRSIESEYGFLGQANTGVFSNADLVANFEGILLYRGLFEDGVVAVKPALIRWGAQGPRRVRDFDFRDHVNEYWDEVYNPSLFTPELGRWVYPLLKNFCADFRADPAAFLLVESRESELSARYAHLGLVREGTRTMTDICADESLPIYPLSKRELRRIRRNEIER